MTVDLGLCVNRFLFSAFKDLLLNRQKVLDFSVSNFYTTISSSWLQYRSFAQVEGACRGYCGQPHWFFPF